MRRTLLIISVVYLSLLAYTLAFLGSARVGHTMVLAGPAPAFYTLGWNATLNRAWQFTFAPLTWLVDLRLNAQFVLAPRRLGIERLPPPGGLFGATLLRPAETLVVGLLALFSVGAIGADLWGRWRTWPACCGYSLTGNESGTGPECGPQAKERS